MKIDGISIIIPAYNEENVIQRCLDNLAPAYDDTCKIEVIVVCNGCKDNTATRARGYAGVKVLETEIGSKILALNMGDKAASFFPRFYIDADVHVTKQALIQTAVAILENGAKAGAPALHIDLKKRNWLVRTYYNVWLSTPYCKEGLLGSGVYGLSREGRQAFKEFPDIISDDGYVRLLFPSVERHIEKQNSFTIYVPKDIGSVIKIKTRSRIGLLQLNDTFPELTSNENTDNSSFIRHRLFNVSTFFSTFLYVAIKLVINRRAARRYKNGNYHVWLRDETARN